MIIIPCTPLFQPGEEAYRGEDEGKKVGDNQQLGPDFKKKVIN